MTITGRPDEETDGYRQGWQNALEKLGIALAE